MGTRPRRRQERDPLINKPIGRHRELREPTKKKKSFRVVKIVLPHILLALFLVGYLCSGAAIFQMIERDQDRERMAVKAREIIKTYEDAAKSLKSMCTPSQPDWKRTFYSALGQLSSIHENRPFSIDPDVENDPMKVMPAHWNYIQSILYALSILTTTGYTRAIPLTYGGQMFAVAYGLIGIPLMVLTAVDIGRFLTDCVLLLYTHLVTYARILHSRFKRASSPMSESQVVTKLVKDSSQTDLQALSNSEAGIRSTTTNTPMKKNLPLWVNASILLVFCTIGAAAHMAFTRNPDLEFLDAFFVAFNLVANLTMEEIGHVDDMITVLYIIVFVTFGLAVLSMCAELAAAELKWIFMKIHYFGRKIRRKRKRRQSLVDQDVKELLKIITEIRTKYPEMDKITAADILEYLHEVGGMGSRRRRDTFAFMPESMEAFKFADEIDEAAAVDAFPSFPSFDADSHITSSSLALSINSPARKKISKL